jgi:hypothetical protein
VLLKSDKDVQQNGFKAVTFQISYISISRLSHIFYNKWLNVGKLGISEMLESKFEYLFTNKYRISNIGTTTFSRMTDI